MRLGQNQFAFLSAYSYVPASRGGTLASEKQMEFAFLSAYSYL